MMILVRNLSKTFGEKTALPPVSFELTEGETLCVLGLSGCGKSTLLKCLAGLVPDYEGEIEIAGKTHRDYLLEHRVAMVFQRYSNFEWLNVFDNLKEAFLASSSCTQANKRCEEMLRSLGLEDWSQAYISELSGGMAQRVALGRALLQDQDLIGLDEPFAALDIRNRQAMQDLVRRVFHEQRRTTVFVTHDIAEAIYVGDKILVLPPEPQMPVRTFVRPFAVNGQSCKAEGYFKKLETEISELLLG